MKLLTVVFLPPLNREPRVYHAEWFKVVDGLLVFREEGKTVYIPFMSILHFTAEDMEGEE